MWANKTFFSRFKNGMKKRCTQNVDALRVILRCRLTRHWIILMPEILLIVLRYIQGFKCSASFFFANRLFLAIFWKKQLYEIVDKIAVLLLSVRSIFCVFTLFRYVTYTRAVTTQTVSRKLSKRTAIFTPADFWKNFEFLAKKNKLLKMTKKRDFSNLRV